MTRSILSVVLVVFGLIPCAADEPVKPEDDPSQWGIVVLARWKERVPATATSPAGVRFQTIRGLNTGFRPFPIPTRLDFDPVVYESNQKLTGQPGDERVLVMAGRKPPEYIRFAWAPTPAQNDFLKNIPQQDGNDQYPVIAYHWNFLLNPDRKIARTSEIGLEYARTDTLIRLGKTLKIEDVQLRIRATKPNSQLHSALAVVYASSGRDQVAAEIREWVIPTGRFSTDPEMAAAFLLSHGEQGLLELEELLQTPEYRGKDRWTTSALGQLLPGDTFSIETTRATLWKWANDEQHYDQYFWAMRYHHDPTLAGYLESQLSVRRSHTTSETCRGQSGHRLD